MSLIFYKSLKYKFKKSCININKKLYLFLFYLSLNIKNLLLLKLYIINNYSFKKFLLYYFLLSLFKS